MTLRTPDVPEPLILSACLKYMLFLVSPHETALPSGSIASETMTVSPTGTLPESGVIPIVVPEVSLPPDPRFLTRQTVAPATYVSAGQDALELVHASAASQAVLDGRQIVVDGRKASAGQVMLDPVQISATSQAPAAARHTAPALP